MKRDPKTATPELFGFARGYLHTYMPKVRRLSPKTVEAYRLSLECFVDYLVEHDHVQRAQVSFEHFERGHLKSWLTWMTDQQHYAPRTVTLRLSAIKAFLAYASQEDITLVALSQAAKALKAPRSPRAPVTYLTGPETRSVLAAFRGQTARSRRNRMLLILLYDTAARVSEITSLTLQDLCLAHPGHVTFTGKGDKARTVPLTRKDDRPPARVPRGVPPQQRKAPRQQAGLLQPPPRPTSRVVSRHGLGRLETGRPGCPQGLPVGARQGPLPHAPEDQSHGPLPTRRPVADHHAPPRPRERIYHYILLRLCHPGHDATSHKRRHSRNSRPGHKPSQRRQAANPLQPPIAKR